MCVVSPSIFVRSKYSSNNNIFNGGYHQNLWLDCIFCLWQLCKSEQEQENNQVYGVANWKLVSEVSLTCFLEQGRTKNICNRQRTLIKTTCHKNSICTKEHMDTAHSQSDYLLVWCFNSEQFKKILEWQKEMYAEPPDGIALHQSWCVRTLIDPLKFMATRCILVMKWKNPSPQVVSGCLSFVFREHIDLLIILDQLSLISPPNSNHQQRKCEVLFEWRRLVPEEFWKPISPKPKEESIFKFEVHEAEWCEESIAGGMQE